MHLLDKQKILVVKSAVFFDMCCLFYYRKYFKGIFGILDLGTLKLVYRNSIY